MFPLRSVINNRNTHEHGDFPTLGFDYKCMFCVQCTAYMQERKGLVHELLYAQDTVLCSYFAQREGAANGNEGRRNMAAEVFQGLDRFKARIGCHDEGVVTCVALTP